MVSRRAVGHIVTIAESDPERATELVQVGEDDIARRVTSLNRLHGVLRVVSASSPFVASDASTDLSCCLQIFGNRS